MAMQSTGQPARKARPRPVALLAFEAPIYAAILWLDRASAPGIVEGPAGFAGLMLVVGRPYGVWFDFVRARFDLAPGSIKPMTLGDGISERPSAS